jgi:hypothetical protein
MRTASIVRAVSVLNMTMALASLAFAIPLNTTAVPTLASSIDPDDYFFNAITIVETDKMDAKPVIPISAMKCMGHQLRREDIKGAKERMIKWYESGNKVRPTRYHAERHPPEDDWLGTTWYICNCKHFWWDPVPRAELDDVERILEEKCGPNQSGWIWSTRWQKGYNVVPTAWFEPRREVESHICPMNCLWKL